MSMAYASVQELYLPKAWANDAARCAAAKVPEAVTFATKPQLAQCMIARAVAAQVPFAWITGDEIYGDDRCLRAAVGGLCDIEAPVMELAALQLAPTISLVVENLNTGIALPDVNGAVVFMGLGRAVDQLEAIGWLRGAQRHLYWGDLDTHSFAILARARRRFPQTVSVLMDEGTLLAHRDLWVREPNPCRVESAEGLTAAELAVYEGLRVNRWGEQVRLEQERVAWSVALEAISNTLENRQ
jgi:hypothetical protein